MKPIILAVICSLIYCTCTPSKKDQLNSKTSDAQLFNKPIVEDSIISQAFTFLDRLQLQSNSKLYSTFPKLNHPCFPFDSTFTLNQSEFSHVFDYFLETRFDNLVDKEINRYTETIVKLQENYVILHCFQRSNLKYDIGFLSDSTSFSGIWVIPAILGKRDVVMDWD